MEELAQAAMDYVSAHWKSMYEEAAQISWQGVRFQGLAAASCGRGADDSRTGEVHSRHAGASVGCRRSGQPRQSQAGRLESDGTGLFELGLLG